MLTTNAMRTSIFQAIMGTLLTTGTVLSNLGLSATQESWASYGVLAAVVQVGYTPFLLAHATQAAPPTGSDDNIGSPDLPISMPINTAQDNESVLDSTRL